RISTCTLFTPPVSFVCPQFGQASASGFSASGSAFLRRAMTPLLPLAPGVTAPDCAFKLSPVSERHKNKKEYARTFSLPWSGNRSMLEPHIRGWPPKVGRRATPPACNGIPSDRVRPRPHPDEEGTGREAAGGAGEAAGAEGAAAEGRVRA